MRLPLLRWRRRDGVAWGESEGREKGRRESKNEYDIEGIPLKNNGEVDGEDKEREVRSWLGGMGDGWVSRGWKGFISSGRLRVCEWLGLRGLLELPLRNVHSESRSGIYKIFFLVQGSP